jgi:hypothetical protein
VPTKRQAKKPAAPASRDKTGRSTRARGKADNKAAPRPSPAVAAAVAKLVDPTAADAETQAKILSCMADPKLRKLTVEERCELIGIGRSTWYRHVSEDPTFRQRFFAACRDALVDHLGPVFEALAFSASLNGKEGHSDRKLFLEVTGHYCPSSRVSLDAGDAVKKPAAEMSDEQLLMAFEGREQLLPPGVLRRLGRDPDHAFDQAQAALPTEPAKPEPKAKKRR